MPVLGRQGYSQERAFQTTLFMLGQNSAAISSKPDRLLRMELQMLIFNGDFLLKMWKKDSQDC